jgi:hypothetical protein
MLINLWAVLVAAIIRMGLGAFWFSSAGFGKQWIALAGIRSDAMTDQQKKGVWKMYLLEFVGSLATGFVLALLLASNMTVAQDGMFAGLLVWIGFTAPFDISDYTWGGKPKKLFFLNGGYQLLVLVVMGAVIAWWR